MSLNLSQICYPFIQFISWDCMLKYMQVGITHNQISTINPATGKVISSYNITDTEQISRIVNSARRIGFENRKRKDILERCGYIKNLAKILKNNMPKLLHRKWVNR
jgi:acyl-CoA reductase-like NAD-dependent aldehyde dehydrogenase